MRRSPCDRHLRNALQKHPFPKKTKRHHNLTRRHYSIRVGHIESGDVPDGESVPRVHVGKADGPLAGSQNGGGGSRGCDNGARVCFTHCERNEPPCDVPLRLEIVFKCLLGRATVAVGIYLSNDGLGITSRRDTVARSEASFETQDIGDAEDDTNTDAGKHPVFNRESTVARWEAATRQNALFMLKA